jgi:hypothetical protein
MRYHSQTPTPPDRAPGAFSLQGRTDAVWPLARLATINLLSPAEPDVCGASAEPGTVKGERLMASQPPQYAGFWIRFVAYIIDSIIMGVLFFTIIGWIIYMPLMWAWKGATLGQMALGLKVVRAADGGPISAGTAILRFVGLIIAFMVIYIGVIWVAFDAKKQGWADKIAGTVVIK